jgi:serine/threonine protein phosphatase PrpC
MHHAVQRARFVSRATVFTATAYFALPRAFATAAAPSQKRFVLLSSGTNLGHPDKPRSEDSYFTSARAIGVSDGVGAWADEGIDAGAYARELMSAASSACAAAVRTDKPLDAVAALSAAHAAVRLPGSATGLVAVAGEDGKLGVVNVGDSGLQVWRRAATRLSSGSAVPLRVEEAAKLWECAHVVAITTAGFNTPRQLAATAEYCDTIASGAVERVDVVAGDLVVAASDGVWDNLHAADIKAVLARFDFAPCTALVRMARARRAARAELLGDEPATPPKPRALQALVNVRAPEDVSDDAFADKRADCQAQLLAMSAALAMAAQRVGKDPHAMSPFAVASKGQLKGGRSFRGGKLDDATAVVALVLDE